MLNFNVEIVSNKYIYKSYIKYETNIFFAFGKYTPNIMHQS